MVHNTKTVERRTSVDRVFDYLYSEIVGMRLLPGTKISEAEIASLFGISRQPVRDAFSKLENIDLLLIRPQRATEVKRFSSKLIIKARFVRAAVEAEVLRRAAQLCGPEGAKLLEASLSDQRACVREGDYDRFRVLDYEFHEALCSVGNVEFAFDVIASDKAKVDRLCVLAQKRDERIACLVEDHATIVKMVISNNEQGSVDTGMLHLSRLDSIIATIREESAHYFDD